MLAVAYKFSEEANLQSENPFPVWNVVITLFDEKMQKLKLTIEEQKNNMRDANNVNKKLEKNTTPKYEESKNMKKAKI